MRRSGTLKKIFRFYKKITVFTEKNLSLVRLNKITACNIGGKNEKYFKYKVR